MVTHNLQQASRISDYTAFLMSGDLIEYGKTSDMFMNPKKQITSDYLNGRLKFEVVNPKKETVKVK